MSRHAIEDAATALAWSLWSELGVPGVTRNHQRVAVDPEPLIAVSPLLFRLDARLRDQVYGWCSRHADRVSASRLRRLAEGQTAPAREAFAAFAATLGRHANVRWSPAEATAWEHAPEVTPRRLPEGRPGLLRLRIRALSGVGARSDILCALLAHADAWVTAYELATDGYSKRNIARVLSELASAGIATSRVERNALCYQLVDPAALGKLVQASDVALPNWRLIMLLAANAMILAGLDARPNSVRQVEAHKIRESIRPMADQLWLDSPPATRGNPDAWDEMAKWTTHQLAELAAGSSPALSHRRGALS